MGGFVAPIAVFLQAFHHDPVKIAAQLPRQFRGLNMPVGSDRWKRIDGTQTLTLDASAGTVTITGVAGTTPLTSLTVAAASQVDLNNVFTTGLQSITGTNIDLNGTTYNSDDGDIAVDDVETMFLQKQFPAGWEHWEKSTLTWVKATWQLVKDAAFAYHAGWK